MSDDLSIRPATSDEVWEDMLLGDTWTLHRLQADRATAVEAAMHHWGPAQASVLPGEMLWRLRADEMPIYISVCPDEERPIVMFNLHCRPERGIEEKILDRLGEVLTRGDGDDD